MVHKSYLSPEKLLPLKTIIASITDDLNPSLESVFLQGKEFVFADLLNFSLDLLKDRKPNYHTLLWSFILNKLLVKLAIVVNGNLSVTGGQLAQADGSDNNPYKNVFNEVFELTTTYLMNLNTGTAGKHSTITAISPAVKHGEPILCYCFEYFRNIVTLLNELAIKLEATVKVTQMYAKVILHYIGDLNLKQFTPLWPIVQVNRYHLLEDRDYDSTEYDIAMKNIRAVTDIDFKFYSVNVSNKKVSLYDELVEFYYFGALNSFHSGNFDEAHSQFVIVTRILAINSRFRVEIPENIFAACGFDVSNLPVSDLLNNRRRKTRGCGGQIPLSQMNLNNDNIFNLSHSTNNRAAEFGMTVEDKLGSKYFHKGTNILENESQFWSLILKISEFHDSTSSRTSRRQGRFSNKGEDAGMNAGNKERAKDDNLIEASINKILSEHNVFIHNRDLVCFAILTNYLVHPSWGVLERNYHKTKQDTDNNDNDNDNDQSDERYETLLHNEDMFSNFLTSFEAHKSDMESRNASQNNTESHNTSKNDAQHKLLFDIITCLVSRDINTFINIIYDNAGEINPSLFDIFSGALLDNFMVNFLTSQVSHYGTLLRVTLSQLVIIFNNLSTPIDCLWAELISEDIEIREKNNLIWGLLQGSLKNPDSISEEEKKKLLIDFLEDHGRTIGDLNEDNTILEFRFGSAKENAMRSLKRRMQIIPGEKVYIINYPKIFFC